MKLFKFICGVDERIGVFADLTEAYDRRTEVDPTLHYLPCEIEEIVVSGYDIVITPIVPVPADEIQLKPPDGDKFDAMDRPALVAWFKENKVEYVPQWGDPRLRETARAASQEGAST